MNDLTRLARPVEDALRATRGRVMEAYRGRAGPARFKADGSAITDLDLELERRLGEVLLGLDPALGLVGEESGVMRAGSPTWHLDPLDGTANFARRIGIFGSQVVLVEGHEPLFAAVYEPITDVFTWAARGAGTWHEGQRATVADRAPREAVVHLDIARRGIFMDHDGLLRAVRQGCYRTRALGTIAIHLRDVAVGAADGYLGGRAYPSPLHDLAPGLLLVREAGGRTSDGRGGDPLVERRIVVAGGGPTHDWLCDLIAPI